LVPGQVANEVEIAEAVELAVQLAASSRIVAPEPLGLGADDV
jgi:hypothetical protein